MVGPTEAKTCRKCSAIKPLHKFSRNRRTKDGLERLCRSCRSAAKRAEYEKDRGPTIARAQKWHAANKDRKREYDRKYRGLKAERLNAIKLMWRAKNPEKVRAIKAAYKKRNPHMDAEHAMRRNARKRQATPAWLTVEHYRQMQEIYREAASRPGGPWHVDHIVPLNGKRVCGLHVPWNLQVLSAADNVAKGNRLLEAA